MIPKPLTLLLHTALGGAILAGLVTGSGQSAAATERVLPGAMAPAVELSASAQKIYKARCLVCHGKTGAGDGPGSAPLNPKPRSFKDAEWQKGITDKQIKLSTIKGVAPGMPPNPDLRGKKAVLAGLVEVVRSYGP